MYIQRIHSVPVKTFLKEVSFVQKGCIIILLGLHFVSITNLDSWWR